MVAAFVRSHGTEFVKAAGTTDTYALTATVPAGNLLVMALVHDNAATASKPIVSSISVAAGETNAWTVHTRSLSTSTTSGAFADGEMWSIKTSVAWASGTSLTVTYDTSITMKSQNIVEFSGVESVLRGGSTGNNYSTTTTAAATNVASVAVGDLVLGLIWGSNVAAAQAGDNNTTGGSWSTPIGVGSTGGSGTTNNYGIVQYKIATSTALQSLQNQAAMTAGNGVGLACLRATIDPLVTQAAYRVYGDGTETGSTALAAQNTAPTVVVSSDANVGVRVRLQETAGGVSAAATDWQLQWEKNTSGTWKNAVGTGVVDTYSETNADTYATATAGDLLGQSFTGDGSPLVQCGFYGSQPSGGSTGTVTAYLYAHSGTFGTSSVGTGSPLATSDTVAVSSLVTNPSRAWFYFTFDGSFTLVNGTNYVIVIGGSSTGNVEVGRDSSGAHAGNDVSRLSGSWFANSTRDYIFQVLTTVGTVLPYDSASLTDAGATTNRLGAGSGSFVAGKVSEDGLVDNLGWTASNYTELLYSVTLKSADLADADSLRFRVLRDGVTTGMTYTAYPTITVSKGPPPPARDRNIRTSNPALSRSFTW